MGFLGAARNFKKLGVMIHVIHTQLEKYSEFESLGDDQTNNNEPQTFKIKTT